MPCSQTMKSSYLCDKIREFCRPEVQDMVCPRPDGLHEARPQLPPAEEIDQPPPLKKPHQCSHCHKSDVTTKEHAPILNRLWLFLFPYPCHNLTSRTQVLLLWPVLQQETLTESLDSAELTSFYSGFQDYSLHKNTPISLHPRIQECSPALPRYTR